MGGRNVKAPNFLDNAKSMHPKEAVTEPGMTERRVTKGRKIERRMTARRMTNARKLPKGEWLKVENYRTENN